MVDPIRQAERLALDYSAWFHGRRPPVHFVIHAIDKQDALEWRARYYREHRIHLDQSDIYSISVLMAGPLVADDGETPVGSLFVLEAKDRAAVDAFARSDPYCIHGVWERIDVHYFNKKRG